MKEDYRRCITLPTTTDGVATILRMIQQPRVNSLSVRTWNKMCFKGNVVFGGRTVATWVLGGVARDSSDGWEVEKGILLCLDW